MPLDATVPAGSASLPRNPKGESIRRERAELNVLRVSRAAFGADFAWVDGKNVFAALVARATSCAKESLIAAYVTRR